MTKFVTGELPVMPDYKMLHAGDTALVVDFGDCVNRRLGEWVLALAGRLNEARLDGVVETVARATSSRLRTRGHYHVAADDAAHATWRY